jgi:hypothetical protein
MESGQQRLFRLTSDSNDGVFDTTYNQDIQIKKGSSIALQSVSFDRVSDQITIDASNNSLTFGLITGGSWTTTIPSGLFPKVTKGEELMENITRALNARIDMSTQTFTHDGFDYSINKGSQWKMELGIDGNAVIRAKTQEPCYISSDTWTKTNAFADTTILAGTIADAVPEVSDPTAPLQGDSHLARPEIGGETYSGDLNHSRAFGVVPMTKGTGCIRVRVAELATAAAGQHSFTFGLTKDLAKLQAGTLTGGDIHYALQCRQPNEGYHFKTSPAAGFTELQDDNGDQVLPEEVSPQADIDNPNDVLEIRIDGAPMSRGSTIQNPTQIGMTVHQESQTIQVGATEIPAISQDNDWYWFISFTQNETKIKLDMVEVDLDSYAFTQIPPAGDLPTSTIASVIRGVETADRGGLQKHSFRFEFATQELASYFGYDSRSTILINTTFKQSRDYKLFAETRAEFSIEAKNYLILFDNIPLESFDTYSQHSAVERNANTGGSRRNLLACVPTKEDLVSGSSVSRIVYEPNSLQYISMNNRNAMITRALKCRVLTSTYQPVAIDGLASLSLLITD